MHVYNSCYSNTMYMHYTQLYNIPLHYVLF